MLYRLRYTHVFASPVPVPQILSREDSLVLFNRERRRWLQRWDSNPRPSAYEAVELPLLYSAIGWGALDAPVSWPTTPIKPFVTLPTLTGYRFTRALSGSVHLNRLPYRWNSCCDAHRVYAIDPGVWRHFPAYLHSLWLFYAKLRILFTGDVHGLFGRWTLPVTRMAGRFIPDRAPIPAKSAEGEERRGY